MSHPKQEDVSTVTGYKDKLVGGVKETVGGLLGIEKMEKEGQKQKKKGEAELKAVMAQQRAIGDRERQQRAKGKGRGEEEEERIDSYIFLKRQAVLSELDRQGGFERQRSRLHHVDTRERNVRELFAPKGRGEKWQQFELKRWNKQPLLKDIRERKTKRPLVHVEPKEKGLMRSIRLGKDDFKLKRDERLRPNLWNELKAFPLNKLKKVNKKDIHDWSAPRLDLLKHLKVAHQQHDVLLREIVAPPRLKHVETKDRTKPNLYFDKNVHVHRLEKDKLLNEVRKGYGKIKHVETRDKSYPIIEKDLHLKKWDKQGFLAEVRQGSELKHI